MVKAKESRGNKGLVGKLEEESLLEIIEPVLRSGARSHLKVTLGKEEGNFYFDGGKMVHATSTSILGSEAAYNLISWRNGVFTLKRGIKPPQKSADIEWLDFMRFFEEEIEKIIMDFLNNIGIGFYLDLRNHRGEKVFKINHLSSEDAEGDLKALLGEKEIDKALPDLRRGRRKAHHQILRDQLLLVRYLKEVRYYAVAIFDKAQKMDLYYDWLGGVFEPKALEAISLALEKADKLRVRGTVLIIDDSSTTRAIMEDTLSEYRFKVITAEDGYEGIVKIKENLPNLIFLDIMMPKLDGYEVLKKIRKDHKLRNIPIVMLSSKGLEKDKGKSLREGAKLYIEKPFTSKKILATVENVLGLE